MPEERVSVSGGAYLIFRHPSIRRRLIVSHGATEIKWSYNLNTVTTPTYGGEVVQVLSTFVGPMTVTGQTGSNDELQRIYDWFLDYMTLAGKGDRRDERAIIMEYPERGWTFKLQVTALNNFQLGVNLIGTPWQIVGEVVNDEGRAYLTQHTMNALNKPLFNATLRQIGFRPSDPTINPEAPINRLFDASTLGDNMQRLIGAWSTGDFGHWGFDALRDPESQFPQTARDYWMSIFGTPWIVPPAGGGSGAGSFTYGNLNLGTEGGIVMSIFQAFEAANMPGILGVAGAYAEASMNPDTRNSINCVGLFQICETNGFAAVHEVKQAHNHPSEKVTKYYKTALQIEHGVKLYKAGQNGRSANADDPNTLWQWYVDAERPQVGYAGGSIKDNFMSGLKRARAAVEKYKDIGGGAAVAGSPKHIIDTIVVPMARQYGMQSGITAAGVAAANAAHSTYVAGTNRISWHKGPGHIRYASDMSNGGSPTPQMDALAKALAKTFGIPWDGSGLVTITHGKYTYQLIYRASGHHDHIHFGIAVA